jgi:hypothetical protein
MSGAFAGTITEDVEGEELSRVIAEHWHAGAGSMLFFKDAIHAHEATGLPMNRIFDVIKAANDARGYEFAADVLDRAFVPEGNVQAVCDLLDQIQALCVAM